MTLISRRVAPDDPYERIGWLRWRWGRTWPLTRHPDRPTADAAAAHGVPWEFVVGASGLPADQVGVIVTRSAGDDASVTLFGAVQTRFETRNGVRVRYVEFLKPVIVTTLRVGPHGGRTTVAQTAEYVAQALHDWYTSAVEGGHIERPGRRPRISVADVRAALVHLIPTYRDRAVLKEGRTVRLDDAATYLECSEATVKRACTRAATTFSQLLSEVDAELRNSDLI